MNKPVKFLLIIFLFLLNINFLSANNWNIPGKIINEENYYPLYKIINILHIDRQWDFYSGRFILQFDSNYLNFIVDENEIYVNRKIKHLNSPPIRKNGVIYVPEQMLYLLLSWVDSNYKYNFNNNILSLNKAISQPQQENTEKIEKKFPKAFAKKDNAPMKKKEYTAKRGNISKISVVIIDPGHGGKDPGAIGQKGLREKDIVLKVGKKVKKILNQKLKSRGIKIVMTRDKDVFISLKKRTEIANKYIGKNKAGIYISIHANASIRKKSRGIETFVLSPVASDDEARAVAAMENGIIDNKTKKLDSISKILSKMLSYEYIRESIELAKFIQTGYSKNLPARTNIRGIKKARFYVLEGSFMPAILTEIGFVTNRKEEKLLRTDKYQTYIAKSIASGIIKFINWYEAHNGFIQ